MTPILQPNEVGLLSRPISKHIDNDKLAACIDEVERLEVKPMIGYTLIKELKYHPENHVILLKGGEYETLDGEVSDIAGLKKAIAYYVYARLLTMVDHNVTRYGLVNKENDDSNRVSWAEKNKEIQNAIETANCYMKEIVEYMRNYPDKYSAFKVRKHPQVKKYKIIGE